MNRRGCTRIARLGSLVLALATAPHAGALAQDAAAESATASESEPASPDTEQARAHFQRGVNYYTEGDLAAALVEFERAYALQPTYRLLYNLGQVAYEQRDYAAAERYFRRYLTEGGSEIDAGRRADVEVELTRLGERVADVRLESNRAQAALFVDDHPVGRTPLSEPVRVSAGRREIRAELPGYPPVIRKVDVVGGEALSLRLDFGTAVTAPSAAEVPRAGSSSSAAIWTGAATAVLGLGTAGMALWTDSDQRTYDDELERMTTRKELDSLSDRVETKALVTDILLGATIVTGTITIILLLTGDDDGDERAPKTAAVQVGPGSVHVAF